MLLADDASVAARPRGAARRARARRHALQEPGARVEHVSLKQLRRALEIYLAALGDGAGASLNELLEEAGVQPRGARPWRTRCAAAATTRADPDHARARAPQPPRAGRAAPRRRSPPARSLRDEVGDILGDDGVLLHQPHPRVAPRHGGTIGRAWVITPAAVFNLLGLPVTQVPLGLNARGSRSASRSPPPTATTTSRSPPHWRSSALRRLGAARLPRDTVRNKDPGSHRDAGTRVPPLEGTDRLIDHRPGTSS